MLRTTWRALGRRARHTAATAAAAAAAASGEDAFVARRRADVQQLRDRRVEPYPTFAAARDAMRLRDVRAAFADVLAPDATLRERTLTVHGRIVKQREMSSKLLFFELRDATDVLQVLLSASSMGDLGEARKLYQRGDVVEVHGFPGKTAAGELSIFATHLRMLAPCLRPLPLADGLRDPERRVRERHVDMLVNGSSRATFRLRSQVISEIRRFLEQRDFLEVETPVMSTTVGGAAARPFETKANALGMDMRLRISPELYLKRLVIGGFDRVFEIGKQFRNEGVDSTHNPEFTTCEFYQAYSDYRALMSMTEEMLHAIVMCVKGAPTVPITDKQGQLVNVDFTPPYNTIDIVAELQRLLNVCLPDFNDEGSVPQLRQLCAEHKVALEAPYTASRILDRLVGHFIEPQCQQPTFLCHHPRAISPLAKQHPTEPGLTSRFELIVAGRELVNAYSELNDPDEQRSRFAQQAKDRATGDVEAHETDADFCDALEYGLPPTAGWGLGIDRLVMMLAGVTHIRDVLLFPVLRPRGVPAQQQQ